MPNEPVIITEMTLFTKDSFETLYMQKPLSEQPSKDLPPRNPERKKLWLEGSSAEEKAIHELDFPQPERYHA